MKRRIWCVCVWLAALAGPGSAATVFNVNVDTSELMNHAAGPFFLNVQLNDGSGLGDGNNSAVLSNFSFGGGGALGSPITTGGVSGSLADTVLLRDTEFLNSFTQGFSAGLGLAFQLTFSRAVDRGPTPDQLSIALLDSSGLELPTTGLASVGSDVILLVDINSGNPAIQRFGADPSRAPIAGGGPVHFDAPDVHSTVPEPESWLQLGSGLVLLWFAARARAR